MSIMSNESVQGIITNNRANKRKRKENKEADVKAVRYRDDLNVNGQSNMIEEMAGKK